MAWNSRNIQNKDKRIIRICIQKYLNHQNMMNVINKQETICTERGATVDEIHKMPVWAYIIIAVPVWLLSYCVLCRPVCLPGQFAGHPLRLRQGHNAQVPQRTKPEQIRRHHAHQRAVDQGNLHHQILLQGG